MATSHGGPLIRKAISKRDVDNRISNARLTEYAKLKDEIANRSSLQNAIMTLDIAAVGTLGGFVLGRQASDLLLLLLIPLSTALELWWLNHAQTIGRIGDYIRIYLWPSIIAGGRKEGGPNSYEEVVTATSLLDRSTLFIPFFVVFIGPSIASIADTIHAVRDTEAWLFWGADVVVFIFSLWVWIKYLQSTRRAPTVADPSEI
jgi:hypothetical protein